MSDNVISGPGYNTQPNEVVISFLEKMLEVEKFKVSDVLMWTKTWSQPTQSLDWWVDTLCWVHLNVWLQRLPK